MTQYAEYDETSAPQTEQASDPNAIDLMALDYTAEYSDAWSPEFPPIGEEIQMTVTGAFPCGWRDKQTGEINSAWRLVFTEPDNPKMQSVSDFLTIGKSHQGAKECNDNKRRMASFCKAAGLPDGYTPVPEMAAKGPYFPDLLGRVVCFTVRMQKPKAGQEKYGEKPVVDKYSEPAA